MRYSVDAEVARAYLLRQHNDLDVFVEDDRCLNMYIRIINRILDGRARISNVYPLHGRRNVIAKCEEDQEDRTRRRIYLIDGDLDLLRGRRVPKLKHLYQIKAYCIENLLLSAEAIAEIASECSIDAPLGELAGAIGITSFIDNAASVLSPLFMAYGIVYELGLPMETTGYSVFRLLRDQNDATSLCSHKVRSRILSIIRAISGEVSRCRYLRARQRVNKFVRKYESCPHLLISGKAYLFPLVYTYLRHQVQLTDAMDRVKVRLAQHYDIYAEKGLRKAVIAASGCGRGGRQNVARKPT